MKNRFNERRMIAVPGIIAAILCAAMYSPAANAADPVSHPHYLHALSNLRTARALIERPEQTDVAQAEEKAMHDIDQAVGEIKRAAIDDGKKIGFVPPINTALSHRDRLVNAKALLAEAQHDLGYDEDDRAALGWRHAAQSGVAMAIADTNDAIALEGSDATNHARYLHAISDVRTARTLLASSGDTHSMKSDIGAVREIDVAIGLLYKAVRNEGSDQQAPGAVDPGLSRHDRLKTAAQLLEKLHDELNFEESDTQALSWRRAASARIALAAIDTRTILHTEFHDAP